MTALLIVGCASRKLKNADVHQVDQDKDLADLIQVKEISQNGSAAGSVAASPPSTAPSAAVPATPLPAVPETPRKKGKKGKAPKEVPTPVAAVPTLPPPPRQPPTEDTEGLPGRRPAVDPLVPGEVAHYSVSYFGIEAGTMNFETLPFVEVNGRKSYHFRVVAKSASLFDAIYAVEDSIDVFMDYQDLVPVSYTMKVKESKQIRDLRVIHDYKKLKANLWEKKLTAENGVEQKKQEWTMFPFAQNMFSTLWYTRIFQMRPGKKLNYWIAHENENFQAHLEILRKETLKTPIGTFETLVAKPSAQKQNGDPHNIGSSLIWFTNDERKLIVRIEAKLFFGSIVQSIESLDRPN